MQGISTKKVVGGKLLRIKTEFTDKIHSIQITGDFFLHPEEKITEIEKGLIGIKINEKKEEMVERVQKIIQQNSIQLIGISAEDIVDTLKESTMVGRV